MSKKTLLSGVKPTGRPHIGNYFGAIKQHIALQDEGECYYFIADYHALTTIQNPAVLRENTRDVALDYLALGLDPEKTIFFRQSGGQILGASTDFHGPRKECGQGGDQEGCHCQCRQEGLRSGRLRARDFWNCDQQGR